jgi:ribosomal protein S18 acetylase RimI-like enzyme
MLKLVSARGAPHPHTQRSDASWQDFGDTWQRVASAAGTPAGARCPACSAVAAMASTAAGQLARLTHLKLAVSAAYPALASSQARLAAMGYVIADLPAADIDRLEGLWRELLDHHLAAAPHLASLGIARDPADSWRVRRAQYIQWLSVPRAAVLVARDSDRLLGYAMIRATDAAGSWQWGDQVGTLETLVVAGSARGTGAGRELLDAARERMAEWGAQVMTISVIAGNERAERFYRREGASDYLHTLILPVRQPLSLPSR